MPVNQNLTHLALGLHDKCDPEDEMHIWLMVPIISLVNIKPIPKVLQITKLTIRIVFNTVFN